ncbi:MAG: RNA polymerase sigma factor [Gemmatimonadales bacterium]
MTDADLKLALEREHSAAFGWALRCCEDRPEEAEDVLQVAYERILDGRARFNGDSSFRTWLFGVVRRIALEQRRRNWLRLARLRHWSVRSGYREPAAEADTSLEERERAERLRAALGQLSRRQQEIMHLVFYQELSVEQAANVLGIPIGTARTHYDRGKRRLRSLLGGKESL